MQATVEHDLSAAQKIGLIAEALQAVMSGDASAQERPLHSPAAALMLVPAQALVIPLLVLDQDGAVAGAIFYLPFLHRR